MMIMRLRKKTMKIKEGFILRKVGIQYVVAATGKASENFNGMLRLNESGAFAFRLLQEGAKPVKTGWDILCEFQALFPGKLTEAKSIEMPEIGPEEAEIPRQGADQAKKVIDKANGSGYIDLKEQLAQLSDDQLKIVSAIDRGASHTDDIIERTGLTVARVLSQLTVLEIKGFVRREPGKRISLNTAKSEDA